MAAISLCESSLASLKKSLFDEFPEVKSSHLSEAIAYCLGFRTHAALKTALVGKDQDPPFNTLHSQHFIDRLIELGYEDNPEFHFEQFASSSNAIEGVISTEPISASDIEYKTLRQRAWRNLAVCAINAGLEQKLFTLKSSDNRFGDSGQNYRLFDFILPGGLHARGYVSDRGYGELLIGAAVNPIRDRIQECDISFTAGDAVATAWLERATGAWLQSSPEGFCCRNYLLKQLAELKVEPRGYGDRGKILWP